MSVILFLVVLALVAVALGLVAIATAIRSMTATIEWWAREFRERR